MTVTVLRLHQLPARITPGHAWPPQIGILKDYFDKLNWTPSESSSNYRVCRSPIMWNEGPLLFSLLWVFIWIIRAVLVRVYLFLLSTLAWDWLLLSRLDFGRYLFNESTGLDVYLPSKYKSHGSPQWPDIVMMQSDSQVIFDSGHATQGKCPTLSQSVSCKEMLSCFPSSDPTLFFVVMTFGTKTRKKF